MQGVTYILQDQRCLEFGFKVRVASHIGYKEIGPVKKQGFMCTSIYIYIDRYQGKQMHGNTRIRKQK